MDQSIPLGRLGDRGADARLRPALAQYLQHWGPIDWQQDVRLPPSPEGSRFAGALRAFSAIETDSRLIARKIAASGVDGVPAITEFVTCWLAEEAEHGRALAALARCYGDHRPVPVRSDRPLTMAAVIEPAALRLARPMSGWLRGAYGALGVMQEFVAVVTYRWLAEVLDGGAGTATLRQMARQEGRHMRFYRAVAVECAGGSAQQRLSRALLDKLWQPPGVDVLGRAAWIEAFRPVFTEATFADRVREVDRIVDGLPGLEGMNLVSRFIPELARG